MAPAAQLLADGCRGELQMGIQRIHQAGFSGAAVAAESGNAALQQCGSLLPALAGEVVHHSGGITCLAVDLHPRGGIGKIGLGKDQYHGNPPPCRNGSHLIQHQCVGRRFSQRYHKRHPIQIGQGRAQQKVPARGNGSDAAATRLSRFYGTAIPHQQDGGILAEDAAAAALCERTVLVTHGIKAAEGADNKPLHQSVKPAE